MIEGLTTTHLRRFFQNENIKNNNIASSLKAALNEYLNIVASNEALKPDEDIIIELKDYLAYLDIAAVGSIVSGFNFQSLFPIEIEELLGLAELLDFSQKKAPSALVSTSENIVAGESHSPKSIYEQAASLTKALIDNQVPLHHQQEVKAKRLHWNLVLYDKVVDIIFDSTNVTNLKETFESTFNKELCIKDSILEKWRQSIIDEFSILEESGFLDKFFSIKKLQDKFDYIYEYVKESREKKIPYTKTNEALLTKLYELIPSRAFKAFTQKLWTLSELPLEMASRVMYEWSNAKWQCYAGSELLNELKIKRETEFERLQDWQNANDYRCQFEDKHRTPGPLPLFELHCMQYSFHREQDPKALYPRQRQRKRKGAEREFEIETEEIPHDESSEVLSLRSNETLMP